MNAAARPLTLKGATAFSVAVHLAVLVFVIMNPSRRETAVPRILPVSVTVFGRPQAEPLKETFPVLRRVSDTVLPPSSARTAETPAGEPVPLKFGLPEQHPQSAAPETADAPVGNTIAVPSGTGADIDETHAAGYSGGAAPTADPPQFVALGDVTELPKITDFESPVYPGSAWRSGREAVVKIEVDIGADGRVIGVRPAANETAEPAFISAAMDSIRNARFSPARRGTEAVSVRATLPVKFRLR